MFAKLADFAIEGLLTLKLNLFGVSIDSLNGEYYF